MLLQNGRGLLQVGEHPGVLTGVLLRLLFQRRGLRRFNSQTPVEVDVPEPCTLAQELQPIADELLSDGACVLVLARKVIAVEHPAVFVEAGVLGHTPQCALNHADARL